MPWRSFRTVLVVIAVTVCTTGARADDEWLPKRLEYTRNVQPLAGYHVEREPRQALIWTGGLVFVSAYAISVGVAINNDYQGGSGSLLIPVVGPLLTASKVTSSRYQCGFREPDGPYDCNNPGLFYLLIADAMVQVTGALLVTGGLVVRRKVWVRDAAFTLAPTFGIASGPRFGLVGAF